MIHRSPWPRPPIPPVTLTEHVLAAGARVPGAPALIDSVTGAVTTHGELAERIAGAAGAVQDLGVERGDVVGLVGPNGPRWPVALHGALAAGATVSPMNPAYTAGELAHQLQAAGATAVLVDPVVDERVDAAARIAGVPTVARFDALEGPARPLPPPVDPSSVAVLPFSSGTTGLPKGVRLTHANLVANLEQHRLLQSRFGPGDVLCAVVPFFHSYGLTLVLHTALVHGAAVVAMPRFDPAAYAAAVRQHGVTRLHVAPPVLRVLADSPVIRPGDLATVQVAVCGAAPLEPALAERVTARFGIPVIQGYGLTEAGPGTHFIPDDRWRTAPAGSVGWLVPGTEGRLEPHGTEGDGRGELWVRGPQVMAGYVDDPAATAAAIDAEGWLRTGDVVTVDDDGCFRIVDRAKELIKYKGYQVPPAELEAVVLGHPAVHDVAVVGLPDPDAGELPTAFVVAQEPLAADELMSWVAERVAPYKKIRRVVPVEEVPRSPTGKILRRMLRDQA